MRRLLLITVLLGLVVGAPASASGPQATARLGGCATGARPDTRYAIFVTSMRALDGTERMAVRFDLGARAPGRSDFAPTSGPGLGKWLSSAPGVDIFRYRKQVTNLEAPATYRAVVSFRWRNARGRVIATAHHTTATCVQDDTRAALSLGALDFAKVSDPAMLRYLVPVHNDGMGDAGPFDIVLTIDGVVQPPVTVTGLAAGTTQTLSLVAPRCKGGAGVRIQVDPGARIEEADRSDNAKTAGCPV